MIAGESQSVKRARNECHLMKTELRVICAIAGEWGKLTCQPHGLILILWKQT
jgi:hypothetical protein